MLDACCFLKRYFLAMTGFIVWRRRLTLVCAVAALAFSAANAKAESCATSSDMDAATRSALTTAGMHYFDFVSKGDAASLRQSAIPSLASDFSAIESTIKNNQAALAGTGQPTPQME